jgi:2-methylisocitrate lyase-like PEP mutase family enzyme
MKPTAQLRSLLSKGLVSAPGAHDGLSALLVERAGFPAVYLGTGALSASVFARPDVELTTLTELMLVVKAICDRVAIPVIVDADTGFGGIHNVIRTVREMEDAGVAAIHLEDQPVPKRCGYFEGGALLPIRDMCDKIDAAINARRDPDFLIIARVDAGFITDFDEAIARAQAYQTAGADMVFVNGMKTLAQARRVIDEAPGMHLYNVSGSDLAPFLSATEIEALGYRLAIYPLHSMRLITKAMQHMYSELKRTGTIEQFLPEEITFPQYQELTGATAALALESKYVNRTVAAPTEKERRQ